MSKTKWIMVRDGARIHLYDPWAIYIIAPCLTARSNDLLYTCVLNELEKKGYKYELEEIPELGRGVRTSKFYLTIWGTEV